MSETVEITEKEKGELKKLPEAISAESLHIQKQELFTALRKFVSSSGEVNSLSDTKLVLHELAKHSLPDTLELTTCLEDLELARVSFLETVASKEIFEKHEKFLYKFFTSFSKEIESLSLEKDNKLRKTFDTFATKVASMQDNIPKLRFSDSSEIIEKIRDYYANFLLQPDKAIVPVGTAKYKKLSESEKTEKRDKRKNVNRIKPADDFIELNERLLEPHYEVSKVLRIIKETFGFSLFDIPKEIEKRIHPIMEEDGLGLYDLVWKEKSVERLLLILDQSTKTRLEKVYDSVLNKTKKEALYRPLDIVYNAKKREAEKVLKDEIKRLIAQTGVSKDDIEIFFDETDCQFKIRGPEIKKDKSVKKEDLESKYEGRVNWNERPKKETWEAFNKKGFNQKLIFKNEVRGKETLTIEYDVQQPRISGEVAYVVQDSKESIADFDESEFVFDKINGNFYEISINRDLLTGRNKKGETFFIKELEKGLSFHNLNVVGGEVAFVVKNNENVESLYRGGSKIHAYSPETHINSKIYDVNGSSVFAVVRNNQAYQTLVYQEKDFFDVQFDKDPKAIFDIQPFGEDDFFAVGYRNGKPVAYSKDKEYQFLGEPGQIKKVTFYKGIPNIIDQNNRCYSLFKDKSIIYLKDQSMIDFVSFKKQKEDYFSATVHPRQQGNYEIFSEGNTINIEKDIEYHSIQLVDNTPFIIFKFKESKWCITKLNTQGGDFRESKNNIPLDDGSFDSIPQILDQDDRVVFAGYVNGVFTTHEWMKADLSPKEEKSTATLDQKQETKVYEEKDFSDSNRGALPGLLFKLGIVHEPGKVSNMDAKYYIDLINQKKDVKKKNSNEHLSESATFAKGLTKAMHAHPKDFLDDVLAVADRTDETSVKAFLHQLFPEIQEIKQKKDELAERKTKGFFRRLNFFGDKKQYDQREDNNKQEEPNRNAYLGKTNESLFKSGDPQSKKTETVVSLRESQKSFFSGGVYFNLDSSGSTFLPQENLNPSPHLEYPVIERSAEINIDQQTPKEISIIIPLGAEVVKTRVKVVDKNKTEHLIAITKQENGVYIANTGNIKDLVSLLYSYRVGEAPYIPKDVNQQEYQRMLESNGFESLKDVSIQISAEDEYFISSIKNLLPKERLYKIEEYVRSLSYYDFDSGEVNKEKDKLPFAQRIVFMEQRLKQLAVKKPELLKKGKRFAGVCTDFGILTTVLLKKSGLCAGVTTGFEVNGKEITTKDVHVKSVILFPDKENGYTLVSVDGTPSEGITPEETKKLQTIAEPSLAQKEVILQQVLKATEQKALGELEALETVTDEDLAQMQNGVLEKTLNQILKYQVKKEHVSMIERICNASLYAGFDINSPIELAPFLRKEIDAEYKNRILESKNITEEKNQNSGDRLMSVSLDFINRLEQRNEQGIEVLSKICEMLKNDIDSVEYRSFKVILAYLKAQRMRKT